VGAEGGGGGVIISRRKTGEDARAWEESKETGPWFCPACGEDLIIRLGEIQVHHFAHRANTDCDWGSGESDEHRRCKVDLFQSLLHMPSVSMLKLERDLKTVRPDISFRLNGMPVAIEVQISNLTLEKIVHRTSEYEKLGVAVLWIGLDDEIESKNGRVITPPLWSKWCHALYFGRNYFWKPGNTRFVRGVRFEGHKIEVPYSEWYSEGGEHHEAGGYDRFSKRLRKIRCGPLFDISRDFTIRSRDSWSGGRFKVPKAKILIDQTNAKNWNEHAQP
jgi:competence protein CoiA